MDKYEIRRVKLAELRDTRCGGTVAELARRLDRSPTYCLRMLYPDGKAGKKRIADDMLEVIEEAFDLPHGWLDGKSEARTIKIDAYIDNQMLVRSIPEGAQDDFRAPYDCPPNAHAIQSRTKKRTDGWILVMPGEKQKPDEVLGCLCLYCTHDGLLRIGTLQRGYLANTFNTTPVFSDFGDTSENVHILWAEKIIWVKP